MRSSKPRVWALGLVSWVVAASAPAQPMLSPIPQDASQRTRSSACSEPHVPPGCTRLTASFHMRFGLADAPFVTARLPTVRGHGFVARAAAALDVPGGYALGFELPFAVISVEQPAGSYVDEATRGNLSLFVRRAVRWPRPRAALLPFWELSLGLPLAERDDRDLLLASRSLAIASALDAYRNQESFTPGTVPVSASLGLGIARGIWNIDARLHVPLYLRFSDAGLPADAETRPVGLTPVLRAGAGARPWPWLYASLRVDAVFNAAAPVAPASEPKVTQLSSTAAVWFVLHEQVSLAVDFVAPIAGPLAGWNYSGGLSLVTGW